MVVLAALSVIITNSAGFGKLPTGLRLKKIQHLPNYQNGAIQNLSPTPMQPDGVSFFKVLKAFLFEKQPNKIPSTILPHIKPNLNGSPGGDKPEIIWFGHSSYLIKINGIRMLVDPIFSNRPSPFSFIGTKAFPGTDFVQADDFDNFDILLITHDHYDHLDYHTIQKIAPKAAKIVASIGVGAHLEKWGVAPDKISELSWSETITVCNDVKITAVPARHFAGRKFKAKQTLWSAFIVKTEKFNIFVGGDSGYDAHFESIGKDYGPFDLALLECGQYDKYWPYIHMFPEQTIQAAKDLNAKVLMPVHWGKFSLALHTWDDSIKRVVTEAEKENTTLVTPKLGETIILDTYMPIEKWWLD